MSLCKPKKNTKHGTLHELSNSFSKETKIFEWNNNHWSTPGTGYGTKPGYMAVLGWKYERPLMQGGGNE